VARLTGLSELQAAFTKVNAQAEATARSIVTKAAAMVEKEAKGNFEGAHAKGDPHVGGDKPNVVTGNLRRSITHTRVTRFGPFGYSSKVGPTAIYGRRVELGGTSSGWGGSTVTTRPFPYFEPAVKASRAKFEALAAAEWAGFLRL
jgi:hypothetical protein